MNDVKVSVVIPVYNRSNVIGNTLNSVAAQTYKNIEVIIVDDCSNDSHELKNKLENYDLDINYIRHETNLYGGAARNTGIKAAKGEYIAFLDSDDIWDSKKLETCINSNLSDNEIIYSKIKDRNNISPSYPFDNNKDVGEYLLVYRQAMQTSSLFLKTKFAREILFDPELKRFQDTDFIIRAQKINNASFRLIESVLVYMTEDDKGSRISSSTDPSPAFFWLDKAKHLLTKKTISVFTFNRIINYSSNNKSRIELIKLFIKFGCYKYLFLLDFKVFVKIVLGSYQSKFRR
ncbi:glycosyltransferase family 2 protein [Aliivibrio fischeri]|uniref:glycosyltransferase family 2 protein n=1 Tax=Aliivibrio fischeri TaxID=668 RepID=UPI0007C56B33|nr:glycosyltransferase family 2 protein [Aliivibrio fischeri]